MIYQNSNRLELEMTIKCLLACHTSYRHRALEIMSTRESAYAMAKEALRKLDCNTEKDEFIILSLYGLIRELEEANEELKIKYNYV